MVSPIPSASSVPMPAVPFTSPAGRRPRLGDAQVQRVIERLGSEPVGGDHQSDRRRLDRDLDVAEADLLEEGQLVARRLDQCLRGGAAVLLVQVGMQRARVDPDADRDATVACLRRDLLDLGLLPQVAGVESQALDTCLERSEGHLVMEVDVGHDRHRRAGDDVRQAFGRRFLVARAADDVRSSCREGVDLGQGALDVGGLRRRHRLHRDGSAVADAHTTQGDATCRPAGRQQGGGKLHGDQCGSCSGWVMSR